MIWRIICVTNGGPLEESMTMLSRRTKTAYFLFAGPLMWMNGYIYKALRASRDGNIKVHLGPGQRSYLDGWINVDANMFTGRCDVWADIRNPLPFHSDSVEAVYSHHMVEHLPNLQQHFHEVYRCLRPGGVYRVGGPNADSAAKRLVEGNTNWFSVFPNDRKSVGGRFDDFILCANEHLAILTFSYIEELMKKAGFETIHICLPVRETNYPDLFRECLEKEYENDFDIPHTLIVEGQKAA